MTMMKVIEENNGKITAELLETRYPTRIVCSNDGFCVTEFRGRGQNVLRFINTTNLMKLQKRKDAI